MKKNNINKDNVNLVQTFVDILNKDNLSELEYEADGIKFKIVSKNFFIVNYFKLINNIQYIRKKPLIS